MKKSVVLSGVVVIIVIIVILMIAILLKPTAKKENKPIKQPVKEISEKIIIKDEIKEEDEFKYYDIHGNTKAELIEQMSKLGPEGDDGKRVSARADWAIDWVDVIPDFQGNVEPVEVIASSMFTYPRWIDKEKAPAYLQDEWVDYMRKLKAHEENHKNITIKYAKKFLTKIKSFKYKSAEELEDKISNYHAQGIIMNGCAQAQQKYDKDTNHGVTENVIL